LSTRLDDLVAWEFQLGNVHSITGHKVAIENSENRLMSNDEEVVLLSFELEDNRFEANRKVMV